MLPYDKRDKNLFKGRNSKGTLSVIESEFNNLSSNLALDQTWVIKKHTMSFLSAVTNNPKNGDVHYIEGFSAKYEFLIFSGCKFKQQKDVF